jgi:hypothetical protein
VLEGKVTSATWTHPSTYSIVIEMSDGTSLRSTLRMDYSQFVPIVQIDEGYNELAARDVYLRPLLHVVAVIDEAQPSRESPRPVVARLEALDSGRYSVLLETDGTTATTEWTVEGEGLAELANPETLPLGIDLEPIRRAITVFHRAAAWPGSAWLQSYLWKGL